MNELDDFLLDEFKERELEILALMAAGRSNAEIGETLFITKETVRWYNKQIYSKLGTSRRTEAVAKAQRLGLIGETKSEDGSEPDAGPKHNLPHIATPFVGRDSDVEKITHILNQPYTPLLTLLGPGGMGKTRLAIEAGHQLLEHYTDGVYLFELAPLNHSNNILTVVLQALGITIKGTADPKQTLFDHCRDKKMLLIFDNFEHILDGAALVEELLQAAPSCRVLATSRERLNLYGESVYELVGISDSGRELFTASARMLQPNFSVRDGDEEHIDQIVYLVGGLPLGIILAAAWVDSLDVDEIAEEISQDLDMLSTEMRNIPQRQRSMRTVLSASWQKLMQNERQACMQLAVFKGGFSRRAANKVADASMRILQRLQHKSFLLLVAERRYDLHPLVRQFALEQLEASGRLREAHERHLSYFHTYVSSTLQAIRYGDYLYPLRDVEFERDNVHLALDWGLGQAGAIQMNAAELVLAMSNYWTNRSYTEEGLHYVTRALSCIAPSHLWANLMSYRYSFLREMARYDEAVLIARQAADYAQSHDDVQLQLASLKSFANALIDVGNLTEAIEVAERLLAQSQDAQHLPFIGDAYNILAHVYLGLGDAEKSLAWVLQWLDLARRQEDDLQLARVVHNVGVALFSLNRIDEAKPYFEESLALKRLIKDRQGMMTRLAILSDIAVWQQDFALSEAYLREAEQIGLGISSPLRTCVVYHSWLLHYEAQAEWTMAIQMAKKGLEIAREHQLSRSYLVGFSLHLAIIYAQSNVPQQSLYFLKAGVDALLAKGLSYYFALCLLSFGYYYLAADQLRQACAMLVHFEHMSELYPINVYAAKRLEQYCMEQGAADDFDQLRAELPEEESTSIIRRLRALLEA